MRTRIIILTAFFLTVLFTRCNYNGNDNNSLRGIVFKDISEVPQFKNYKVIGGDIFSYTENSVDFECVIINIADSIHQILIVGEFKLEPADRHTKKIRILDTINIDNIKGNEHLIYSLCRPDPTSDFDPKIIALVGENGENEFTDNIVRAWRIDTKVMEIRPIENTKGITCVNVTE